MTRIIRKISLKTIWEFYMLFMILNFLLLIIHTPLRQRLELLSLIKQTQTNQRHSCPKMIC